MMYEALRELVARQDLRVGVVVRAYLVGLRNALADETLPPGHPDRFTLDTLQRDLAGLLGLPSVGSPTIPPLPDTERSSVPTSLPSVPGPDGPPPPEQPPPLPEPVLIRATTAPERPSAGPPPTAETGRPTMTSAVIGDNRTDCVAALRLSPEDAAQVRARPGGHDVSAAGPWTDIPSLGERLVVLPPKANDGESGLRLWPDAKIPTAIREAIGLRDGDLGPDYRFAVAAAQLLALAPLDPQMLDHLPSSTGSATRRPSRPEDLKAMRSDLMARLSDYAVQTDPQRRLLRLINLAEALSSVRPIPAPAADSWWSGWHKRIQDDVYELSRTVPDAQLTVLSGPYPAIKDQTKNDALVSGPRGTVYACLRLWARIGGQTYPGRVLVAD